MKVNGRFTTTTSMPYEQALALYESSASEDVELEMDWPSRVSPLTVYAMVERYYEFPRSIDYRIINECFIPDECHDNKLSVLEREGYYLTDEFIDDLVRAAYINIGRPDMVEYVSYRPESDGEQEARASTRGLLPNKWCPRGEVWYYDDVNNRNVPLEGITVKARRAGTTYTGTVGPDGKFSTNGRFRYKCRFYFNFSRHDFQINSHRNRAARVWGPQQKSDWYLTITPGTTRHFEATIFRAAYQYY